MDVELDVDVVGVGAHGIHLDAHGLGDAVRAVAHGKVAQHVSLASRKGIAARDCLHCLAELAFALRLGLARLGAFVGALIDFKEVLQRQLVLAHRGEEALIVLTREQGKPQDDDGTGKHDAHNHLRRGRLDDRHRDDTKRPAQGTAKHEETAAEAEHGKRRDVLLVHDEGKQAPHEELEDAAGKVHDHAERARGSAQSGRASSDHGGKHRGERANAPQVEPLGVGAQRPGNHDEHHRNAQEL